MSLAKFSRTLLFRRGIKETLSVATTRKITSAPVASHLTILKNRIGNLAPIVYVKYSTDKGKVPALFEGLGQKLNAEVVKKTSAVYQFVLSGAEEGKWYLDLKTESGKWGKGDCPQAADVTLTMDSTNFLKMFDGKLKPTTAYMTGRLKIKGNLQMALKLEQIMNQLK